jgi:hypothetical protein
MNAEHWHKYFGFPIPTKEAYAGLVCGIGVGIIMAGAARPWYLLEVGWFCIAAGGTWARAIQKKRIEESAGKVSGISN